MAKLSQDIYLLVVAWSLEVGGMIPPKPTPSLESTLNRWSCAWSLAVSSDWECTCASAHACTLYLSRRWLDLSTEAKICYDNDFFSFQLLLGGFDCRYLHGWTYWTLLHDSHFSDLLSAWGKHFSAAVIESSYRASPVAQARKLSRKYSHRQHLTSIYEILSSAPSVRKRN